MNNNKQKLDLDDKQKKLIIVGVIVTAIALFFLLGGQQWLSLENLQENRMDLLNYAEQNYWSLFVGMGLVYAISTALSLPGGVVLSLATGFLFGRWMGTLLIVVFATLGATLLFWLARYLIADWAEKRLQESPLAAKIIQGFETDAFNYMLFLRLVPLFPFWLVNLAPAFTPISSRIYIISTLLGIIPGSFVFANLGQSLGQIESLQELLSIEVILAFSLLGLLSLIPVILKHIKPDSTLQNK